MIHSDDADSILEQMERLGRMLGITVRYEILGDDEDISPIRSGFCRLNDKKILLIDNRLSALKKCSVLAQELKRFDFSHVFVPPAVRRLIQGAEDDF